MDAQQNEDGAAGSGQDLGLPPAAPTVWPTVSFADVDAGIGLLTDVLGFVVTALHRDDSGTVVHAEARRPDGGGVMFGQRAKDGEWGALGGQGVYIAAADASGVDEAWAKAQSAQGIEILQELHEADYGNHEFGFRDADGNLWSMGTYRGQ